jgi:hypothetical protein
MKHQLILYFLALSLAIQAQDTIVYSLNARFNPGTNMSAPFLSTVNQYDRHSFSPNGLSTWANVYKATSRTFDYGFGVELNSNLSPTEKRFFPAELYAEGKVGPFLAVLGMKRTIFGNQDADLSSGGLIGSQNSRPIPSLTFETKGWVDVPLTKGYLAFKGGMANGAFTDETVTKNTLMHHKWLDLRIGGSFPVNVNYGLQHVAQWAGESPNYGRSEASLDNFMRVFLGRSGSASGPATEYINTLGNHIISQYLGLSLQLKSVRMEAYWQDINEDKPILRMNKAYNKRDGLWGLSVRMPRFRPLYALVGEFLSTTDQAGPWHDLDGVILGGTDNYYNNGVYPNGWSFYGMTIGNPWITSPKYNTDGSVSFQNNCVRLFYLSGLGELNTFKYRFTTAYSLNWGLSHLQRTTPKRQFSGQLEVFHPVPNLRNTEFSLGLSGDRGQQYGNNLALLLGIRYAGSFLPFKNH